jgi:hypothetical protein
MSSEERLKYYMEALKLTSLDTTFIEEEPTPVKEEPKEEAKKPKRCQHAECNKKLVLTDFACKCKQFYCAAHRFSAAHSCTFDYKGTGKEQLTKQLAEVKGSRLEKI